MDIGMEIRVFCTCGKDSDIGRKAGGLNDAKTLYGHMVPAFADGRPVAPPG